MTPQEALAAGLSIIPTGPDKKPLLTSWKPYQTRRPTEAEFSTWMRYNPAAWAMVTGKVSHRITLDFDGASGIETMRRLGIEPHRTSPSGGGHADFEHPGWHVPTLNSKSKRELGQRWPGLDIRADGGYVLFAGRTEKGEYTWLRDPAPYSLDILPVDLREFLGLLHPPAAAPGRNGSGNGHLPAAGRVDSERLIAEALGRVGSEGRNNAGFWLACQLRDNDYSESEAAAIMRDYAGRVPSTNTKGQREPYSDTEALASVREAYRAPAREPWEQRPAQNGSGIAAPCPPATATAAPADLLSYLFNDHGNSERLIALYADDLRYSHAFNKWLVWDGCRWQLDTTEQVRKLAKKAMLEFLRQAIERQSDTAEKFARQSLEARRIASLLSMTECEIFVTPDQLDTNPWLLNFRNGTVDLRTGNVREHRREDFITKVVHHNYRPAAKCPTFQAFLLQIMGDEPDASEPQRVRADRLVSYLQKAFGYSLTSITAEKVVFMAHGNGNNGKTTLLSTFLRLLEEYAVLLQIDTLMVRQESNNTQADLADLRGARFVMTSETEEGQRLAEGKLKRITQGMGKIKAVRKYENPIEFCETHKLWIDANHKPAIRGTDNAIWNRLHPIPFEVTIPPEEIDRELPDKLLAEAEGILAWAVQGAMRWHSEGLGKPSEVDQANRTWRSESDQVGRFVEECCITGAFAQAKGRQLYTAYRKWGEDAGEHPIPERDFAQRIKERGFSKRHSEAGAVYSGIGLKTDG